MSLITAKDVQQAAGLEKLGFVGRFLGWVIYQWAEIPALNKVYDGVKDLQGEDFYNTLLQNLGITYECYEEDLKRIPKEGPFILVANHPLGALDGIIMLKIVTKIRPDFKIMGNFLLKKIAPIEDNVIPVNPFDQRKEVYNSTSGMKEALLHIRNGGCLGIFPAGEVSRKNFRTQEIYDRRWQISALKLIKKVNVPVIPMYFHAKNGRVFYRWGVIHPDIQTALLPIEMMRHRVKPIKLRIGKPILPKQLETKNIKEYGKYVRDRVYLMKSFYSERKKLSEILKLNRIIKLKKPQEIALETNPNLILEEIEKLQKDEEKFLFETPQYQIFFSKAHTIPNIVREIGRLRELTFREIGEGSNKSLDLDEFDQHYHHLFLWDKKEKRLVGSYRLGLGRELYHNHGIKGFYVSSLFNFEPEISPFFQKTIEMGRAFIRKEYQQRPLPLFTLWKGIILVCLRFPEHKFLLGGVSISNKFSNFCKSLIVEFMRSNYYDSVVGQYVIPKKEYKVKLNAKERDFLEHNIQDDVQQFDKMIDDLEPSQELRLPVLVKKYFKQNAKVIAFNVDPKFNNAIDGLMYIRISDLPEKTVQPVMDEFLSELRKKKTNCKE